MNKITVEFYGNIRPDNYNEYYTDAMKIAYQYEKEIIFISSTYKNTFRTIWRPYCSFYFEGENSSENYNVVKHKIFI